MNIGNGSDIVQKVDIIDGYHDVPSIDSVVNAVIRDVLGNKADTVAGNSAIALLKQLIANLLIVGGFHGVPLADAVANTIIRDVLGNKADTVAGTSLVALVKQLIANLAVVDGFHDVPSQDSVNNNQLRDVVGNKTDTHSGSSLYGHAKITEEHLHNEVFLYPNLAGSVPLQKAAGAWAAHPTPTQVIAAGIITDDFDLHFLNIADISANGEYSICLYKGAALSEILIGTFGAARNAVQSQEGSRSIITPLIAGGERISASISSDNVGQDTLNIKVEGHTY